MESFAILSEFGSIFFVFSLLAFALFLLKKFQPIFPNGKSIGDSNLVLEAQLNLGFRQKVLLVNAGKKVMVLAVTNEKIFLIESWDV
jgi:flagellar biogenesis protein FliO